MASAAAPVAAPRAASASEAYAAFSAAPAAVPLASSIRIEVAPAAPAGAGSSTDAASIGPASLPRGRVDARPSRPPRPTGHDSTDSEAEEEEERERERARADAEEDDEYQVQQYASADADEFDRIAAAHGGPPVRPRTPVRPRRRPRTALQLLHTVLDGLPSVLDAMMRGVGPALVLCAWLIFALVSYVYFHCIVPCRGWGFSGDNAAFGVPISVFALFLLFEVYYNHVAAVFTKPGGVPKDWPVPANIDQLIRDEAPTLVRGVTFSKYCKTCKHPKAPRMHHCHVCKTCVARMDHHWIGGCVGFANYRYFYNFLFWLWLGCLFLIACTLQPVAFPSDSQYAFLYPGTPRFTDAPGATAVADAITSLPLDAGATGASAPPLVLASASEVEAAAIADPTFRTASPAVRASIALTSRNRASTHESWIFFILVLTLAAACAVGVLLTLHTFLALTNQTTIELYANRKLRSQARRRGESNWMHLYDLGWRRNWVTVLGAGPNWSWFGFVGGGGGGGVAARGPWLAASFFSKPLGLATLHGDGLHYEVNPRMAGGYYAAERQQLVQEV